MRKKSKIERRTVHLRLKAKWWAGPMTTISSFTFVFAWVWICVGIMFCFAGVIDAIQVPRLWSEEVWLAAKIIGAGIIVLIVCVMAFIFAHEPIPVLADEDPKSRLAGFFTNLCRLI